MSGKTSLWELFGRFLVGNVSRAVVLRLSLLWLEPRDSSEDPDAWFVRCFNRNCLDCRSNVRCDYSWAEILATDPDSAAVPVVLLLDESQIAHIVPELTLWKALKSFQLRENRFCVLFGAYGGRSMTSACATPVSLADSAVWSCSDLRFRREEREEIFQRLRDVPEATYVYPLPTRTPLSVPCLLLAVRV